MNKTNRSSRRCFLKTAGLAAASGSLLAHSSHRHAVARAAERPNILLVLSDDHSFPHLSCYNNPDIRTPHLQRFSEQGMRFDRTYVTCPQCVPSRASIMTGRSPVALQMTRFSAPLPAEMKIFPEILRAHGYFSGVAGRTYHLDGSDRQPPETSKVFAAHKLVTFPNRLDYVKKGAGGVNGLAQFKEFLGLVPQGKPFVLQLCFNDPHRPLDRGALTPPHDPARLKLPAHYPDTQLVREDFARYYDEIGRLDAFFGQVMSTLDERGLSENTLVLFLGDNGSSQMRGKGTLFEFGIHVPMLVRWPGKVKSGVSTAELISAEDVAPTLLDAAGVAVPREMTGRSFFNLLSGRPFPGRSCVFAQRGAHGSGLPNNSAAFDLCRCVVTQTHKLIYNALWQLPYTPVDCANDPFWKELKQMNEAGKLSPLHSRILFSPTRPMFELYDLDADPNEFQNLAGDQSVETAERELKALLQEWMILERDFLPLPVPPSPVK